MVHIALPLGTTTIVKMTSADSLALVLVVGTAAEAMPLTASGRSSSPPIGPGFPGLGKILISSATLEVREPAPPQIEVIWLSLVGTAVAARLDTAGRLAMA